MVAPQRGGFFQMLTPTDMELYSAEVKNNPVSQSGGGLSSFFQFLGNVVGTVGSSAVTNYVAERDATSRAKQQAMLNRYHDANPSLGPNSPGAAQTYANQTFLERYLPAGMLYNVDPVTKEKKMSVVYWVILGGLAFSAFFLIRRLFRK